MISVSQDMNAVSDDVRHDAQRFLNAKPLLASMRKYTRWLKSEEMSALRRKALSGDVEGARVELDYLLRERNVI